MFARLAWGAVIAAWGVMEAVGLRRRNDTWPTFTDLLVKVRGDRKRVTWWLLLGFWTWLGFHVFVDNN